MDGLLSLYLCLYDQALGEMLSFDQESIVEDEKYQNRSNGVICLTRPYLRSHSTELHDMGIDG